MIASPLVTETVVLLHGLGANRLVMSRLAQTLRAAEFSVHNWGYRSTRHSIDVHAQTIARRLQNLLDENSGITIHFVAHSMGSVIARRILRDHIPTNLGRVVMLGPPNSGSHIASMLASTVGRICRPLSELADSADSYVNQLGEPDDLDVGIIAAREDRVVRLESTTLACQRDHIVLSGSHGMLPWRKDTGQQVIHFLRHGRFVHNKLSSPATRNEPSRFQFSA